MTRPIYLIIAAIGATVACSKPAMEQAETTAAVPVSVEEAKTDTLKAVINVTGTVAPAPGGELVITAPESARIAEITKAEGDAVAEGDVLVRFDIPTLGADVQSKRAGVSQANARLDLAKAAVTRLSGLVQQGIASQREVQEARREQLDAEANLAQAQSALASAESLAGRTVVRARFAGVVAKRWHNAGDFVEPSASDPVLKIINPKSLQVVAAVPVSDLSRIQIGRAVKILGPGQDPDDADAAVIAAKAAQVDAASATGDVRITFSKPTKLAAGTVVQIEITAEEKKNALVVPTEAVVKDGEEIFVFVAGDDNKAHKQAVTLGLATREVVEIKSGLKAGDKVITKGQEGLPDGAAITIEK